MRVKAFELRDAATFIPVMAIQMTTDEANVRESWLLRRAGYGGIDCVMLVDMRGGRKAEYDHYSWNDRTFQTAHAYIIQNFDSMLDGEVICVEFLLGEREQPKTTELGEY